MSKIKLQEIRPHVTPYRDDHTGIAWVENSSTGCGHSAHPNIDATGSVRGMKDLRHWDKNARTVRTHGFNAAAYTASIDPFPQQLRNERPSGT